MVDRLERNKDLIQELVESTAVHVGSITTIITKAVADVAREIGEIITDGFEMREAAKLAEQDEARHVIDIDTEDPELDDQADRLLDLVRSAAAELSAALDRQTSQSLDPIGRP